MHVEKKSIKLKHNNTQNTFRFLLCQHSYYMLLQQHVIFQHSFNLARGARWSIHIYSRWTFSCIYVYQNVFIPKTGIKQYQLQLELLVTQDIQEPLTLHSAASGCP